MLQIQYDLFKTKEQAEWDALYKELADTKKSMDKVRKGLFARHNELAKMFLELKKDHELLISNLCHGKTLSRYDRLEGGELGSDFPSLRTGTLN